MNKCHVDSTVMSPCRHLFGFNVERPLGPNGENWMYDMAAAGHSLLHHGFPIRLKTLSKAQALIQVYWSQLVIHTGSTKSSHFKCNYFVINCPNKPNWCSTQWGPMLFIKGLTTGHLGEKKKYNNKNTFRELYSVILVSLHWLKILLYGNHAALLFWWF